MFGGNVAFILKEDIIFPKLSLSQHITVSIALKLEEVVSVSMIAYTLAVIGSVTVISLAWSEVGGFPHCLTANNENHGASACITSYINLDHGCGRFLIVPHYVIVFRGIIIYTNNRCPYPQYCIDG